MARSIAVQVMEGLRYLHRNRIAHCDLKSRNVLIGEDGPKIADLGCAKSIGTDPSPCSVGDFLGTPMFMAPEVARGEQQGFEADIWAFGCLVIEMVTGADPWTGSTDPVSLLYQIGFSEDVPEIPALLSEDARDFLGKCLARDPRQRWTAEQLLRHPFLSGPGGRAKVARPDWGSPIGVLDQAFWDSTSEVDLETSPDVGTSTALDSGSPAGERIEKLIEKNGLMVRTMPDWTDDEDWFAVRSTDHDRHEHISSLDDAVLEERPSNSTSTDESELELSILANSSLSESLYEEYSGAVMNPNTNRVYMADCNEVVDEDLELMDLDFETDNVNLNVVESEQFDPQSVILSLSPPLYKHYSLLSIFLIIEEIYECYEEENKKIKKISLIKSKSTDRDFKLTMVWITPNLLLYPSGLTEFRSSPSQCTLNSIDFHGKS